MKQRINHFFKLILIIIPLSFSLQSCEEVDDLLKDVDDVLGVIDEVLSVTGWLAEDEQLDEIPEDIVLYDDDDSGVLKNKVDLSAKFPPIGNQGQYGTCVTWAVGYNLKTALNAIEKGWTSSQLNSSSNQTSATDLWFAIPSGSKGAQCDGTSFQAALDMLISTGAASFSDVPYSKMGSCSGKATGSSSNKLTNYRKIADDSGNGMTLDNFKGYLNAGRPIVFGARLGDRFMDWSNSSVINYDTYNDPGMQHAYHAMVLTGYDDSKSAFRVRNSWGNSWGDNGDIWVDYTFFLNNFCYAAFVAQNTQNVSASNNEIKDNDLSSGYDLLAYSARDYEDPEGATSIERAFTYEVYNSGDKTIYSNQKWSVVYMYYNATKASDYQIIFEDYYTDEFEGDNGENNGKLNVEDALCGGWWNNAKVEPGKIAGFEEYGDAGFKITYTMPEITGKYYLVVLADAYDAISEVNEDNNFYFITAENGKPLEFKNGVLQSTFAATPFLRSGGKKPAKYEDTDNQSVVKPGNLNAYSPEELRTMLLQDKKTGKLNKKIQEFRLRNAKPNQIKKMPF